MRNNTKLSHRMNILRIIDELEQLVEEGKGILGQRLVPEEAFFLKVQQLRSALPKALVDAETPILPANMSELSRGDKLRLMAQWSAELARDEA